MDICVQAPAVYVRVREQYRKLPNETVHEFQVRQEGGGGGVEQRWGERAGEAE